MTHHGRSLCIVMVGALISETIEADATHAEGVDGAIQVTFDDRNEWYPSWSPDSAELSYVLRTSDGWELRVQTLDTGESRLVFASEIGIGHPDWSPDGSTFAFVLWGEGPDPIWRVNADGTGLTQLTHEHDGHPSWSPDGNFVAFDSNRDEAGTQIWVVPAVGGPAERVTNAERGAHDPCWSPDGTSIAYYDVTVNGIPRIWVQPLGGGGATLLTTEDGAHATWSPDGREIAFQSHRDGDWIRDLWAISMNGDPRRVTKAAFWDTFPDWSPDGRWIAFSSSRSGSDSIWMIPARQHPVPVESRSWFELKRGFPPR